MKIFTFTLVILAFVSNMSAKDVYNIVVLGSTGVGKSSLLNMFAGQDVFKVGNGALSETQLTIAQAHRFMGKSDGIMMRLIDTQGLSDTSGDAKDMEHIKNMVESIRTEREIDLFVLCFDGVGPKYSSYVQSTVSLFNQIFPEFMHHTVLVFNKWTDPNVAKLESLKAEYQSLFKKEFNIDKIPCFFIDTNFNRIMLRDNEDGTQSERYLHPNIQAKTSAQVQEFINYLIAKKTTCDVRSIETKETENAALLRQQEEERLRLQREIEENNRRIQEERTRQEAEAAAIAAANAAAAARAQAEANRPKKKKWYQKIFG